MNTDLDDSVDHFNVTSIEDRIRNACMTDDDSDFELFHESSTSALYATDSRVFLSSAHPRIIETASIDFLDGVIQFNRLSFALTNLPMTEHWNASQLLIESLSDLSIASSSTLTIQAAVRKNMLHY